MTTFHCDVIRRDLTAEECVERQNKRLKDGSGTRPPGFQYCDPEVCTTGRAQRDALEQAQREEAAGPLAELELDEGLDELLDAFDLAPEPAPPPAPSTTREAEPLVPPPATPSPAAPASTAAPVPEPAQGKPDPSARQPALPTPKERPMPEKLKCKTPECSRDAVTQSGHCRPCYQKAWRAKQNGKEPATPKHADKVDIARKVKVSPAGKVTPLKAPPAAPQVEDGPPENVAEYFAALSNEDLAEHLTAALAERSKRLAGLDALRAALKE